MANVFEKYYLEAALRYANEKNTIIDAFVEFFGEDKREYITNKLDEVKIIWFIPDNNLPLDLKNYKNKTKDFKEIIATDMDFTTVEKILDHKQYLSSEYAFDFNTIIVPVIYNSSDIIHELVHALTNHILAKYFKVYINNLEINAKSNKKDIRDYSDLSEIIVERITMDILNIMVRKGIKIDVTSSYQGLVFPYIEEFYQTFLEVIKESVITGNLNYLIKSVGKNNYDYFAKIIESKTYEAIICNEKKKEYPISRETQNRINKIIKFMKEDYNHNRKKNLTEEELKDFLQANNLKPIYSNYYELVKLNSRRK